MLLPVQVCAYTLSLLARAPRHVSNVSTLLTLNLEWEGGERSRRYGRTESLVRENLIGREEKRMTDVEWALQGVVDPLWYLYAPTLLVRFFV